MDLLGSRDSKSPYRTPDPTSNILQQVNGVQFILYLFLGPETRYIRTGVTHQGSDFKKEYFQFSRIDPSPISAYEFIQPLFLSRKLCILLPAIAYAMTFLFCSVLVTVELPQLFGEKFHFNEQQLGLQFLGIIVGSIIGEQLGGILSDTWMNRRAKKICRAPAPEFRLWLSYPGFMLGIIGIVVFLVRTEQAPELQWNITPIIGIAFAGGGNQIITTVLITYAVDSHPHESASIGVFITFVRQVWGFIGPFWCVIFLSAASFSHIRKVTAYLASTEYQSNIMSLGSQLCSKMSAWLPALVLPRRF